MEKAVIFLDKKMLPIGMDTDLQYLKVTPSSRTHDIIPEMYTSSSPDITSELWIAIPAVMLAQPFFKSFFETLGKELAGVLSKVIKNVIKNKTYGEMNLVLEKESAHNPINLRVTISKNDLEGMHNNLSSCLEEIIALLEEKSKQNAKKDNTVEVKKLKCMNKTKGGRS